MRTRNREKKSLGPGIKRTPQRLAILDYLEGNTLHPSADEIYRAVSKKYHSMSIATVYNTLKTLTQSGAIRELTIDPDRKRYDPDTTLHHQLICLTCRKIADMPGEIAVDVARGAARDFTVTGSHVEFYGHCTACRKKRKPS